MPSPTQPNRPQTAKPPQSGQTRRPSSQGPQKAPQAARQPSPQRMIYNEAKGAHQAAKQILDLLEPTGDGEIRPDPLDEIKQLLGQIVEHLAAQQIRLDSMEAHLVAIREGRRLGRHSGSPQ